MFNFLKKKKIISIYELCENVSEIDVVFTNDEADLINLISSFLRYRCPKDDRSVENIIRVLNCINFEKYETCLLENTIFRYLFEVDRFIMHRRYCLIANLYNSFAANSYSEQLALRDSCIAKLSQIKNNMKVTDFKNFSDRKFYTEFDKELLKLDSLAAQKNYLVEEYNKKTFCRDELIKRKLYLMNHLKYDYKWFIVKSFEIYFSFIFCVLGGFLGLFNTLNNIERWIACIGFVLFVAVILLCLRKKSLSAKARFLKETIPIHEIQQLELKAVSKILSSMKEEVDIADYI